MPLTRLRGYINVECRMHNVELRGGSWRWTVNGEWWTVNSEEWTVNSEQETGNREQWTVNSERWMVNGEWWMVKSEQETGNRKQGTGNREQGTVNSEEWKVKSEWWMVEVSWKCDYWICGNLCNLWTDPFDRFVFAASASSGTKLLFLHLRYHYTINTHFIRNASVLIA